MRLTSPRVGVFAPQIITIRQAGARFFIIKSYSEDDVHKSIKYGLWASTVTGNGRLDAAYREHASNGPIYLFFSVNASGQFSGMARMESAIDYKKKFGAWAQDKWSGSRAHHPPSTSCNPLPCTAHQLATLLPSPAL